MAPLELILANWNFSQSENIPDGFRVFIQDRSLVITMISKYWARFATWLSLPYVYAPIIAWAITFTVVVLLIMGLGFGPSGIVAGSLMAAFQGWMYGGFTPAGGLFATLTSVGMFSTLMPAATAVSAIVATGVAIVVWFLGVGR